jgi:DNA polymerase epsilon subunit 1
VESVEVEEKVDLEEVNHLSGRRKEYLKVNFRTVRDLTNAKNPLKGLLDKRRKRQH